MKVKGEISQVGTAQLPCPEASSHQTEPQEEDQDGESALRRLLGSPDLAGGRKSHRLGVYLLFHPHPHPLVPWSPGQAGQPRREAWRSLGLG